MKWFTLDSSSREEKLEQFSDSLESHLNPKLAIYWTLSLLLYIIFSEIIRTPLYNLAYDWLDMDYNVVSTTYISFFIISFIIIIAVFYLFFKNRRGDLTDYLRGYFSLDNIVQNIVWFTVALSFGLAIVHFVQGCYNYWQEGVFAYELYIYSDLIVAGLSIVLLLIVYAIVRIIIYIKNR